MNFHFIHYTLKLTLPFERVICFICKITFKGLNALIFHKFFHVTFINQTCHIRHSHHHHHQYHAASTNLPDHLSPPFSIVHRSREVFYATSCFSTELLYIGSSWSYSFYSSMRRSPREYVAYEFVLTSPAKSCMCGSYNFDSFVMGGRWPYISCFIACCLQDLFITARSILA